jgi:hypothetical protein
LIGLAEFFEQFFYGYTIKKVGQGVHYPADTGRPGQGRQFP